MAATTIGEYIAGKVRKGQATEAERRLYAEWIAMKESQYGENLYWGADLIGEVGMYFKRHRIQASTLYAVDWGYSRFDGARYIRHLEKVA